MKSFILLLSLFTFSISEAQVKTRALKKVTELQMPRTIDDEYPGTRGASVAWHPVQKKYYAVMAGNMLYPLAVFDASSKRVSGDEVNALIDSRGLWYNPTEKRIEGNTYDNYGWFYYKLDEKGIPYDYATLFEGQNQPTVQCVGAYNTADKKVMFLGGSQVYFYNISDATAEENTLLMHWGRTAKEGPADNEDPTAEPEDYNNTSIVYTNLPSAEIGTVNFTNKQIELYNKKDGFLTQILTLPETVVVEKSFNFAYANGIYWLFNIEKRKWVGYK